MDGASTMADRGVGGSSSMAPMRGRGDSSGNRRDRGDGGSMERERSGPLWREV
jgi:hypothetical protein